MARFNIKFGDPVKIDRQSGPDCTPSERVRLQKEIDENCKGEKCKGLKTDQDSIHPEKLERMNKSINARTAISKNCFRGEDPGHNETVIQTINTLISCQGYS